MADIQTFDFRDSTLIICFYVVKSMIKSNTSLTVDITELKRTVAGDTKTIQTATNKVSDLQTTVENLQKRHAKLEKKT